MTRMAVVKVFSLSVFSLWLVFGKPGVSELWAQPYDQGKTIRVIVFGAPGGGNDLWARLVARHLPKHIAGAPGTIVQNMPGAAGMIATNYVYGVAKPDGLTIGLIAPALYQAQLVGRPEVKFNWADFGWIGTGEGSAYQIYIRADTGHKSLEDLRRTKEPARCAESALGSMNYAYIRLVEEVFQANFSPILGYKGSGDMNLAIERGEAMCRSTTISALLTTEPPRTWLKTGFVRVLIQSGRTRHAALAEVPTIWEQAEKHAIGPEDRQLIQLVLAAAEFGRPFVAPPRVPKERLTVLREAFLKTMKDPEFLREATKAGLEVEPTGGAELERLAKDVIAASPKTIQRLKNVLE
jgi:tripartite-type tricarboxylate transporter receptor subunit TctC